MEAYVTSENLAYRFTKIDTKFASVSMSPSKIKLDPTETYQDIDGFGAALTGSSCYNLMKMSAADRARFLKETFDPEEGMGFSFIRMHIGGSDFSMDEYTCCDKEGIEFFEIPQIEREGIFPVLREIMAINPELKIMGSPWSCPRWMKVNPNTMKAPYNSWTSGRLNPEYYDEYAEYFVKWVQEMEAEGFPIFAITMQNEPLNHGNSMSLYMPWEDQLAFIKHLGPAFEREGIDTKILLFDHNYNYDNIADQQGYPLHILADKEAAKYIDGSAWHNYGGRVTELDRIHEAYPDKEIFFTEASIGTWNYDFNKCLLTDFSSIFIGTLKRYGRGVTLWNLILDDEGAPNRPGGCRTCFGAIEISSESYSYDSLDRKSHYYNIAHCSKVIKADAWRVASTESLPEGVEMVGFVNPDSSLAVVAANHTNEVQQVVVQGAKREFTLTLQPRAIASARWTE